MTDDATDGRRSFPDPEGLRSVTDLEGQTTPPRSEHWSPGTTHLVPADAAGAEPTADGGRVAGPLARRSTAGRPGR